MCEADIAEAVIAVRPTIIRDIRANREFLGRAVRYLARRASGSSSTSAPLDFGQPVAVLYIGVLHLVADDEYPYGIVARTVAATVPGSYLALTQPASDVDAEIVAKGARQYNANVRTQQTRRTHEQTARFFGDLELVPPGVVLCQRWHPDPDMTGLQDNVSCWGGVARKN